MINFLEIQTLQIAINYLAQVIQWRLDYHFSDRSAQPDYAHLILEIAKTQTEYKLNAATRFRAGKDASGVDLFYQLDSETIFHQAAIVSLQGLFLASQEIATGGIPQHLLGLYASPIANSFDG